MGWIVGKQGSYISQLSRKSGATISISESTSREFGIIWKYVQITGSGRAVDRAKKLLHIRLDRLDPKNYPVGAPGRNLDAGELEDPEMADSAESATPSTGGITTDMKNDESTFVRK